MKVHPNAIKIGNPTSQCALLGLKLVQLSTLAGRISYFSGIWGYRGCNNPGDLGRGVLVSPKCCKFKVLEGIG